MEKSKTLKTARDLKKQKNLLLESTFKVNKH